jgi:hypothetical protein
MSEDSWDAEEAALDDPWQFPVAQGVLEAEQKESGSDGVEQPAGWNSRGGDKLTEVHVHIPFIVHCLYGRLGGGRDSLESLSRL